MRERGTRGVDGGCCFGQSWCHSIIRRGKSRACAGGQGFEERVLTGVGDAFRRKEEGD